MKTKVEIEDGKVVIVLVPENEFEERVIEDYSSSGRDGVVEVVKKKNVWTMEESGVIKILLREIREKLNEVQPPTPPEEKPLWPVNSTTIMDKGVPPNAGTGIFTNFKGEHHSGRCAHKFYENPLVRCSVNERSNYQVCPICGNTDIEIIKEDSKPFGE